MKLFVYEYITSGALIDDALPKSLAHEGDAMLHAILRDLSALQNIELYFMRDSRLPTIEINATSQAISTRANYIRALSLYIEQCDYTLVIAPETNDVLLNIAQQVPQHKFLGCSETAITTCSNKYHTAKHLELNNIATPKTSMVREWLKTHSSDSDVILKPVDGAGCIDTYCLSKQNALQHIQNLPTELHETLIVQPLLSGTAASICCFINHKVNILNINEQFIKQENQQIIFEGCANSHKVNELLNAETAQQIVESINDAIEGLWGFIGIDLVLTESGPVVIEINPRLTTAYLDLKNHLDFNPAQQLIEAITLK